jgi:hypothetical protein
MCKNLTEFGEIFEDEEARTPFELLRDKDLHKMLATCSKHLTIGRRKSFPSDLVSMAEGGGLSEKSARSWASRARGSANWKIARSAKRRVPLDFRLQLKQSYLGAYGASTRNFLWLSKGVFVRRVCPALVQR